MFRDTKSTKGSLLDKKDSEQLVVLSDMGLHPEEEQSPSLRSISIDIPENQRKNNRKKPTKVELKITKPKKKDNIFDERNFRKSIEKIQLKESGNGKTYDEKMICQNQLRDKFEEELKNQEFIKKQKSDIQRERALKYSGKMKETQKFAKL